MLIRFALRRIRRTPRLMSMLVLSISLVSAFVALAPIYVREVTKSAFEVRLENLDVEQFKLELENSTPLDDTTQALIQQTFTNTLDNIKISGISARMYPRFPAGTPPPDLQMRPLAFRDFDDLFTLSNGRLPEPTPDDESIVEFVMTVDAWERLKSLSPRYADTALGVTFPFGEEATGLINAQIVGLVDASFQESDPFWEYREFVFGDVSAHEQRDEFMLYYGVITTEAIFDAEVAPQVESTAYYWEIQLNPQQITVDDLPGLRSSIIAFENNLRDQFPNIIVRSPLLDLVDDFDRTIRETEQPIILLAVLIATLMFYNLITIMTLIFEQQQTEWAIIVSRGGSKTQLMALHLMTIIPLGIFAALLGPIFAQIGMIALAEFGPQAAILTPPTIADIPSNAFVVSIFISIITLVVLTIPAYPLAKTRLLDLKQRSSRPPSVPAWQRFFLDFILLAVGIGFLSRQISLASSGELTLADTISDPEAFLTLLSADSLRDPFNLAAPVLLLTGAALLWMRLFPFIMRGLSTMFSRLQSLATQMALWNVERNPNHYAQIVLLIVGTLAIGTASLSLNQTRDTGAWTTATQSIGADAQLTLAEGAQTIPDLPGVIASERILKYQWDGAIPNTIVSLIGIENTENFPELTELDLIYPGAILPEDTVSVSIDFFAEDNSEESTGEITNTLIVILRNALGLEVHVPMQITGNVSTFTTYTANLQGFDTPLRFEGIAIDGERDDDIPVFEQSLFFDNLRVTLADDSTLIIEDFEDSTWEPSVRSARTQDVLAIGTTSVQSPDDSQSLRVLTNDSINQPNIPTILYNPQPEQAIPAIVSPAFADIFGSRARLGRDMRIGDTVRSEIIAFNELGNLNRAEVFYIVVGFTADFPGVGDDEPFLIAQRAPLRYHINADRSQYGYFDYNTVSLELENREPSPELIAALSASPDVIRADFAWDEFQQIQRDPLPNAITGMLFAGFWVSLVLILIDFTFYMAVTTERRLSGFAVLLSMGWERRRIWQMLTVEQAAFITPALIVGVVLGVLIAYLILPFMALIGQNTLNVPGNNIIILLIALIGCFSLVVIRTANRLMHIDISSVWRTVE